MRAHLSTTLVRIAHLLMPSTVHVVETHHHGVHRVEVLTREGTIIANLEERLA